MNRCAWCGKKYNEKEITETWSSLGQSFFCSYECDLEYTREKSKQTQEHLIQDEKKSVDTK